MLLCIRPCNSVCLPRLTHAKVDICVRGGGKVDTCVRGGASCVRARTCERIRLSSPRPPLTISLPPRASLLSLPSPSPPPPAQVERALRKEKEALDRLTSDASKHHAAALGAVKAQPKAVAAAPAVSSTTPKAAHTQPAPVAAKQAPVAAAGKAAAPAAAGAAEAIVGSIDQLNNPAGYQDTEAPNHGETNGLERVATYDTQYGDIARVHSAIVEQTPAGPVEGMVSKEVRRPLSPVTAPPPP